MITVFFLFFFFFSRLEKIHLLGYRRRIFIDRNSFMPRDRIKRIKLIYPRNTWLIRSLTNDRIFFFFFLKLWKKGARDLDILRNKIDIRIAAIMIKLSVFILARCFAMRERNKISISRFTSINVQRYIYNGRMESRDTWPKFRVFYWNGVIGVSRKRNTCR